MNVIFKKRKAEEMSESKNYYENLKKKLKDSFRSEIYYKMEVIKILKEIKDNKYYKLDGYRIFEDFIKDYDLARTQVYGYLKIANAIQEGLLKENYVIQNGVTKTIAFLKKSIDVSKKSKQNPIKPLRFQLKSQESYDFYKSNAKFTGYLLDKLFNNEKEIIERIMGEYKQLK
ncbi:chromosome replication/partitioning protein [Borreliella valaisiana]|uniref:chromosome replication/partitioning protein n=1 Tax=Borreliella valaisiana TaxID=62088 RepID=UPI00041626A8|nr:chromosome replication/partitioning protein [Borreliella valaisiana]